MKTFEALTDELKSMVLTETQMNRLRGGDNPPPPDPPTDPQGK